MRVALLGAGGMLATAIAEAFAGEDLTLIPETTCDITQPAEVERVLGWLRPRLVINAAAYTDVDGCESNEALATAVNGEAVGTIGRVARSLGATVVHFSTDYVFDGRTADGYPEDAPPDPVNAYGRSKALGERRLIESGADAYLVRTAWLYGVGGKNFVETMLRLSSEQGSLSVVNDQIGSPTYTRDLAAAVRALVVRRRPLGVYHRTNSGAASWYEFAREILRRVGRAVPVTPVTTDQFPRPAPRPAHSILRTTKLPPLRHWTAALVDYLNRSANDT